jgi:hypothetical protein
LGFILQDLLEFMEGRLVRKGQRRQSHIQAMITDQSVEMNAEGGFSWVEVTISLSYAEARKTYSLDVKVNE